MSCCIKPWIVAKEFLYGAYNLWLNWCVPFRKEARLLLADPLPQPTQFTSAVGTLWKYSTICSPCLPAEKQKPPNMFLARFP